MSGEQTSDASTTSPAPGYNQRHIVRLLPRAELLHRVENTIQNFACRLLLVPTNRRQQPLFAEFFMLAVVALPRLRNAIGVDNQNVAGRELASRPPCNPIPRTIPTPLRWH